MLIVNQNTQWNPLKDTSISADPSLPSDGFIEVKGIKNTESKINTLTSLPSGCTHGPNGRCLNCASVDELTEKKEDIKSNKNTKVDETSKSTLCLHGPKGRCLNCISNSNPSSSHIPFDLYLSQKYPDCGTHSLSARCLKCASINEELSPTFLLKNNCTSHKPFPKGMCANCLPKNIVPKRQIYRHIDYSQIMNYDEISSFIRYWQDRLQKRVGYLFGYYSDEPSIEKGVRAVIEALYEPPQENSFEHSVILDDPFEVHVGEIARALGFVHLGWTFSTFNQEYFMTGEELIQTADLQHRFAVHHPIGIDVTKQLTLILRDKEGKVEPEMYMVSQQAQNLVKEGLISIHTNPGLIKLVQPEKYSYKQ